MNLYQRWKRRLRDWYGLRKIPRIECDVTALPELEAVTLDFAAADDVAMDWESAQELLGTTAIPKAFQGVNPGDRRALFYLCSVSGASSVLEVGTNVGASTVHFAISLQQRATAEGAAAKRLVSVDIYDVNDAPDAPWVVADMPESPRGMIARVAPDVSTEFVTSPALDYMRSSKEKFDLIFLDGDHFARAVYQEVPAAARLLNPGGLSVLHCFFPGLKPLWSNGSMIAGPRMAVARFRAEGAPIAVRPLGALPWETKLNSSITSLALAYRTPSVS